MKQGTIQHRKFLRLKHSLGLRNWQATGLLESLWQFTALNADDGQLTPRCTPEDIARSLEWEAADFSRVIDALVDAGWIDRTPEGDLLIHDWADHMPDFLRERLRKRKERHLSVFVPDSHGTVGTTKPNPTQPSQAQPAPPASSAVADSVPSGFAKFWAAWPQGDRKTGKAKCVGLWRRLRLEPKADAIVAAVEAWKQTESWTKDRGEFIPMPQTWLTGGRWEDVPGTKASTKSATAAFTALSKEQQLALLEEYWKDVPAKEQAKDGAFGRWLTTRKDTP